MGSDRQQPARPMFLFGCPRSGTTLLRVMLNAHPAFAIPPENRFVGPLYYRRHGFGRPGTARAGRLMARFITRRGSGAARLGATRDGLVAEFAADPPESVAEALDRVFSTYARDRGRARWGDKRPAYYTMIRELAALFPQAQFVHILRDGRACAASLKREPFGHSPARATATWLNAMAAASRAGRLLGPDQFHELRYEDLVTDPEKTLRRLCDFLGEPYVDAMAHPEEVVREAVPAHFQQHAQIAAGVHSASVRTWEQELSPAEVATVELLGRRHLVAHGYDLTRRGRPSPGLVARVVARRVAFEVGLSLTHLLDRHTGASGARGRLARALWYRLKPRRLLSPAG